MAIRLFRGSNKRLCLNSEPELSCIFELPHHSENRTICMCYNKSTADHHLCFLYIETSVMPLHFESELLSYFLWLYSLVCVGPGWKPVLVFSNKKLIINNCKQNNYTYWSSEWCRRFMWRWLFKYVWKRQKIQIYEPPHGKTNNLHRRKQRRRSASR